MSVYGWAYFVYFGLVVVGFMFFLYCSVSLFVGGGGGGGGGSGGGFFGVLLWCAFCVYMCARVSACARARVFVCACARGRACVHACVYVCARARE